MRSRRSSVAAIAAGMMAMSAGAAEAGVLEIVYWGTGTLEWLQVDGRTYNVSYDSVTVTDIYDGSHTITFGAGGTTRTVYVNLSSANAAKYGSWCMSLELDQHQLLGQADCEEMWDYYYYY